MSIQAAKNFVSLGEIASISRSSVKPEDIRTGTIYVGLEHITEEGGFVGVSTVANGDLASNKFRFDEQHILYGKLRPYLRKIARPSFSGICSTDILPILPGPHVDRGYLYHFLRTPAMIELATSRSAGANLPRLSPSQLASFEIPLPPLPEQRRIAAILDAADALRAKRRAALGKLDALGRAVFLEMFGEVVGNPKRWRTETLGSLTEVATGSTPSRDHSEYYGGHIPWVKTTEINWKTITQTSETVSQSGVKAARLRLFPKGSVLIAMYGQGTTRGKSAILGIDATVNQACAVILPSNSLTTEFLAQYLRLSYATIRSLGRGGNQPNLNLSIVQSLPIIVPDLALQQQYTQFQRQIECLQQHYTSHLTRYDQLFSALQERAFRGQL